MSQPLTSQGYTRHNSGMPCDSLMSKQVPASNNITSNPIPLLFYTNGVAIKRNISTLQLSIQKGQTNEISTFPNGCLPVKSASYYEWSAKKARLCCFCCAFFPHAKSFIIRFPLATQTMLIRLFSLFHFHIFRLFH